MEKEEMSEPNDIEAFIFSLLQAMSQLEADDELIICKKDGIFICYSKLPFLSITKKNFDECEFTLVDTEVINSAFNKKDHHNE